MNQPRTAHTTTAVVLIGVLAAPVLAQNGLPYSIESPPDARFFGSRVVSGGDANNDGFDDVFVVDDGPEESGEVLGRWFMYSGVDGALLWSGGGTEPAAPDYPFSGSFVGDLDGDDCDDVLLGRAGLNELRGGVDLLSGRTGALLHSYRGIDPGDRMGRGLAGLGDVNNDDVPDFAFTGIYSAPGYVTVRSGVDGGELHRLDLDWARRLRSAGDIDGDDRDDLAIGRWSNEPEVQEVVLISGATGKFTRTISKPEQTDWVFGWQIAAGADVTGDDVPDLLVSGSFSDRRAYLHSGATGELVSILSYEPPLQLMGVNLAFADLTGDGAAEAVVAGSERMLILEPLGGTLIAQRSKKELRPTFSGAELAVGDVNGDGLADIITGLIDQQPGSGRVRIESGGRMLASLRVESNPPRDEVRRGATEFFAVFSGPPDRTIRLVGSRRGIGCTFVPQLGICIDMQQRLALLGAGVTDSDGFAEVIVEVPSRAPLGPVWIQALDINDPTRGPITSNVLRLEIVD